MPENKLSKVIGRFLPNRKPSLGKSFKAPTFRVDEGLERTGLIPREVKPSELARMKVEADSNGTIGPLFELYDKMAETDSRIAGLIGQLRAELLSLNLKFEPSKKAKTKKEQALAEDYARVAEAALDEFDVKTFSRNLTDAYMTGLQMFDLVWGTVDVGNGRTIQTVKEAYRISPAKFKMEMRTDNGRYGRLNILTDSQRQYGVPVEAYDERKLFIATDTDMTGRWDVAGIHRTIVGWWLVKTYAQVWWAEYAENYGKPMRIARHPGTANEDVLNKVEKFLKILGSNGYALIPEGIELQLLEASQSSNLTHQMLIQMCNEEIALAIVGQMETQSTSKYGSYAKAKELGGIRYENMKYACGVLGKNWTALVDLILRVNYGPAYIKRLRPKVSPLLINPEEAPAKISSYDKLQKVGVPVEMDHIYEQTGIPKPKEGAIVLIHGQLQEFKDGETGFHNDPLKPQPQGDPAAGPQKAGPGNRKGDGPNDKGQNSTGKVRPKE